MAEIRVLVVDPGEDLGGAQLYLLRLAGRLRERGVHQVLAASEDSDLAQLWLAAGYEHVDLGLPADRSIRRPDGRLAPTRAARELGRTLSVAGRIARLARQCGAAVLHGNGHWTHLDVVAAGRLARLPAVVHLHEQSRDDALGRLRAVSVRRATAAVAVSHAVARSLPAWATTNIHVIHPGVDTTHFTPGPANPSLRAQLTTAGNGTGHGADKPRLVLILARMTPAKGIDHAIHAIAGLPPPLTNTHLAIAGTAPDPTYHHTLHHLAHQYLPHRTHFLGHRTDTSDLLRTADALLLPSQTEGLGLCLLEAHATKTPTIAYPAGGCAELIQHNTTGLLARQDNIADLTHQLTRLLTTPALAQRLTTNAHHHITHHHTLERQADRNAELLRAVVLPVQRQPP